MIVTGAGLSGVGFRPAPPTPTPNPSPITGEGSISPSPLVGAGQGEEGELQHNNVGGLPKNMSHHQDQDRWLENRERLSFLFFHERGIIFI